MAKEIYFLMPGVSVSKAGLQGKKLECKKGDKPLKIDEKYVEILEKNLPFLISEKKVVTASDLDAVKDSEANIKASEKANEDNLSKKMIALVEQAETLGIEVPEKITQKELKTMIQEKFAANKNLGDLRKQAEELEIEFSDETTTEELEALIKEGLE